MEKECYLAPARIFPYTGCYPAQFHKFTLSCICEISSSSSGQSENVYITEHKIRTDRTQKT